VPLKGLKRKNKKQDNCNDTWEITAMALEKIGKE